jgi:hypothetical protein
LDTLEWYGDAGAVEQLGDNPKRVGNSNYSARTKPTTMADRLYFQRREISCSCCLRSFRLVCVCSLALECECEERKRVRVRGKECEQWCRRCNGLRRRARAERRSDELKL